MATIRIDDEVYGWLQSQARAFEDTPNTVLRRIAGLDQATGPRRQATTVARSGSKTPQGEYRAPLLAVLAKRGGEAARAQVLKELERLMSARFTEADTQSIPSGDPRWQKTAEWEVRAMRIEGLLKPVKGTPTGYWALTDSGRDAAKRI